MTPGDIPPTITVTTGPAAGRSVQIEGEVVVGREGADLTINDAELSRRHAVLRATSAGVVIEDLGSLNGTFVNDQRISVATILSPGDKIRMGVSWLQEVRAAPSAADPTPIIDTESTRQRPVVGGADPTPIVDTESTRQRPVVGGADPTPIIDTESTRQRPVVGGADPTPIVDTESTRQRPVVGGADPTPIIDTESTRQRPVVGGADPTPIIDTESTRQRPVVGGADPTPIIDTATTRQRPTPASAGWEGTVVSRAPAAPDTPTTPAVESEPPQAGSPPSPGAAKGLPAMTVTIIAGVAILLAVGIALASNLKSSKSAHAFSATISATATAKSQQGQAELAGNQQGGLLGAGTTLVDEFFSAPGSSSPAGSALLSARITSHLSAGTLVSIVKANVTPRPGGGSTIAGTATITGGSSRYKHATGTYAITGTQASPSSATIFTLHGSISY